MDKLGKRLMAVAVSVLLLCGGAAVGFIGTNAVDIPAGYIAISTPQELSNIRNNLSGKYILTADIDLSGWGNWEPIGGDSGNYFFSGTLDGNGYAIRNIAISIKKTVMGSVYAGLFGFVQNGVIKNLELVNGSVEVNAPSSIFAGGIVGYAMASTIDNCANRNTPIISSSSSAYETSNTGGIVGYAVEGAISRCSNTGGITSPASAAGCTGGLVGQATSLTTLRDSYNTGTISSTSSLTRLGGIAGNITTRVSIQNFYNVGLLNGVGTTGGIAGNITADSTAYARNFYSLDTTASTVVGTSSGAQWVNILRLTDTQMRQQSSFTGFDFTNVWEMPAGGGYPVLRGQGGGTQPQTYAVNYNANCPNPVDVTNMPLPQIKNQGQALTLRNERPNRTGYEFKGWVTTPTATVAQYQPGGSYTTDAAVTLYAVWEKTGNVTIVYPSELTKGDKIVEVPLIEDSLPAATKDYSQKLSLISAALAAAAYTKKTGEPEGYIKAALQDLGFGNIVHRNYYTDPDDVRYGVDNVAFSFAKKTLPSGKTLVAVVVRGTVGEINFVLNGSSDWRSNFKIGAGVLSRTHYGFATAMEKLYPQLVSYLGSIPTDGSTQFLITGHSRGAAVGNLLTVKLVGQGVPQSAIYNYNFATPDVAISFPGAWGVYENIFNICNRVDIVPSITGKLSAGYSKVVDNKFPGELWGKYGKTSWFTKHQTDENILYNHAMDNYIEHVKNNSSPGSSDSAADVAVDIAREFWGITTVFLCPVDIEVIDKMGKTVASVKNNELVQFSANLLDCAVIVIEDEKFIWLREGSGYTIKLTGTSNGTMEYMITQTNFITGPTATQKKFSNVVLTNGKTMTSVVGGGINVSDVRLFVTDSNGNRIKEIQTNGNEVAYTAPTLTLTKDFINLNPRKTGKLSANGNEGVVTWTISEGDQRFATIDPDGTIHGKRPGTITVTAITATQSQTIQIRVAYNLRQLFLVIFMLGWVWLPL